MPNLFGIPVSPDVYAANHHLTTKQPKRAVVKLWKSEREFQAAVIKASRYEAMRRPEYGTLFHIANENAHRQPGVVAGTPDLFLPVLRSGKGGMFIELKVGTGKPSQAQLDMIYNLRQAGYECVVIWDSVDEVMQAIETYLGR